MFQNPWVIGIGGGVISSFIVLLVKIVLNRMSKKEYYKRINEANNDVLAIFRQVISEDDFPDKEIIESIINAESIKYKVKLEDMNNGQIVIDCLITEIFSSNFISVDRKLTNSGRLLEIKKEYKADDLENLDRRIYEMKSSSPWSIASATILFAVIFFAIFTLLDSNRNIKLNEFTNMEIMSVIIGALSILVSMMALTLTFGSEKENSEKEDEETNLIKNIYNKIKKIFLL